MKRVYFAKFNLDHFFDWATQNRRSGRIPVIEMIVRQGLKPQSNILPQISPIIVVNIVRLKAPKDEMMIYISYNAFMHICTPSESNPIARPSPFIISAILHKVSQIGRQPMNRLKSIFD